MSTEGRMRIHEGGCLCSAIRYRITGTPLSSVVCHCRTCRRASGAPTVAWLTVDRGRFDVLRGSARTFHSSPGVMRRFCADCGSALTYENSKCPATIDVTTASLDDPGAFAPTAEVWLDHKISWQILDENLSRHPQGS
jgi:hypothetical protein